MALFNRRKKSDDVLPAEVREYYQAERREKTGVAWLLALVTLLVTFALAAALFFGGRWVYNTLFGDDKESTQTTSQEEQGPRVDEKGNVEGSKAPEDNQQGSEDSPENLPANDTSERETPSTPTPTQTPNTGPSELVNTGPGDEL